MTVAAPDLRPSLSRGGLARLLPDRRSTPGRLSLLLVSCALLSVVAAVLGTLAMASAASGVGRLSSDSEPLLRNARTIYTALADADTTASSAFLSGGLEPAAATERYATDVDTAGRQLSEAASRAGTSGPAADAVQLLSAQLPTYAGLVQTARANNRQGFPVGAAYLSQASALNRSTLLPAADRLLVAAQSRVSSDYGTARGSVPVLAAVLAGVVLLGVLGFAQWFLFRRTNRIVNVPLAAASGVTVLLLAATGIVVGLSHAHLSRAAEDGSAPISTLSRAQIAVLEQRSDENLTLVARGAGAAYETDFDRVTGVLNGPGGLLDQAARQASDAESRAVVVAARAHEGAFLAAHRDLRAADDQGDFPAAVALSAGPRSAGVFDSLVADLNTGLAGAQSTFEEQADAAGRGLGTFTLLLPLGLLAVAALAAAGLSARLKEYR